MGMLSFAVRAYRVLKEVTLVRDFLALREGKIVFTHPRPGADIQGVDNPEMKERLPQEPRQLFHIIEL